MMQVYKVPKVYIIYNFALAGSITLGGLVMGLIAVITDKSPGGQMRAGLFLSAWLGFWVWGWYVVLCKRPLEVRLADEGSLEFRSVIGSTKITVSDIISIKEVGIGVPLFIKVRHTRGTVNLLGRLTGFDELLDRLLTINPAVELNLFFG